MFTGKTFWAIAATMVLLSPVVTFFGGVTGSLMMTAVAALWGYTGGRAARRHPDRPALPTATTADKILGESTP